MDTPSFDAFYYKFGCGEAYQRDDTWLQMFERIAGDIVERIHPATAFDAGCAMGMLVEKLREKGVEAWGRDISEYAISQAADLVKPYCEVGSITEPLERRYDLITVIEVTEHMPADQAQQAIANLCACTDAVLFSSTPYDFQEPTHINVQQPEYWAREFARHNFYRDLDIDASFLTAWAVLYRRGERSAPELAFQYERKMSLLFKENADLRTLALKYRDELKLAIERKADIAALEQRLAEKQKELRALDETYHAMNSELESLRKWKSTWLWKVARALKQVNTDKETKL